MSIHAMSRVWEHSKQKGTALLILLAIADYAKDDGTGAYPSIDKLAKKSRMSGRHVQRVIRDLEDAGELVVHYGAGPDFGKGPVNLYDIALWGDKLSPHTQNVTPDKLSPLTNSTEWGDKSDSDGVTHVSPESVIKESVIESVKKENNIDSQTHELRARERNLDPPRIWQNFLDTIRLQTTQAVFDAVFKPAILTDFAWNGGGQYHATLTARNKAAFGHMAHKWRKRIENGLSAIAGGPVVVEFLEPP